MTAQFKIDNENGKPIKEIMVTEFTKLITDFTEGLNAIESVTKPDDYAVLNKIKFVRRAVRGGE